MYTKNLARPAFKVYGDQYVLVRIIINVEITHTYKTIDITTLFYNGEMIKIDNANADGWHIYISYDKCFIVSYVGGTSRRAHMELFF